MRLLAALWMLVVVVAVVGAPPPPKTSKYPKKYDPSIHGQESSSYVSYEASPVDPLRPPKVFSYANSEGEPTDVLRPPAKDSYFSVDSIPVESLVPPAQEDSYTIPGLVPMGKLAPPQLQDSYKTYVDSPVVGLQVPTSHGSQTLAMLLSLFPNNPGILVKAVETTERTSLKESKGTSSSYVQI